MGVCTGETMNRVKRHVHLLHLLSSAGPQQRKAILKTASNDQIKSLCEICHNLLRGNIPTAKVNKLVSYKRVIRQLADKKIPISRKRKLFINQRGSGFLSILLPTVLSLLGIGAS